MTKEEIKQLSYLLQKLNNHLGEDRFERIMGRTVGTFNKWYDEEEELDAIAEDIEKYLNGEFEYLDIEAKKEEEAKKEAFEREKREKEILSKMREVIEYFK